MVSAPTLAALALLAAAAPGADAFASSSSSSVVVRPAAAAGRSPLRMAAEDASAQALSDYMAKSHEEKLRAVKDVEAKKNSEIETLKAEIQQLKSSSGLATTTAPVAAPLAPANVSELESKLASYQNFMADYIVNAQEQKLLAVKEAELKAEKKFQERLEKLFEASGIPLPADVGVGNAAAGAAAVAEESLYQKRNAQVVASADAGQSRWGSMEVAKLRELAKSAPVASVSASAASAAPTPFEARSAQVAASAAAGQSRWGSGEVAKAQAIENGAAVVIAEAVTATAVKEKKPVSLEDRVNLGAQLLGV